MTPAIDYMNSYKGDGFPNAMLPFIGLSLGAVFPYVLSILLDMSGDKNSAEKTKLDNVFTVLESLSLPALLFLSEFALGVIELEYTTEGQTDYQTFLRKFLCRRRH
jgi:hypothetical protein